MWRKALGCAAGGAVRQQLLQPCRMIASQQSSTTSYTLNSMILRSLKDHYLEISKMTPPPKISPPSPFTVVKGALDDGGHVLKRAYNDEEIAISVMRMVDIVPDENMDENISQLFVGVDINKPGVQHSLHFLCGLYPDALGIHSVQLRSKAESSELLMGPSNKYTGPVFEDVNEKVRDALHGYIEERGINMDLFPFLQAWLYVKDHRDLMRWFKTVGTTVNESNQGQGTLKA